MALPFLPGNTFDRNLGKEKYHKSHHFDNKNSVAFMFGDDRPGIGGDALPGQRIEAPRSRYPRGEGSCQPAWVAFDKQVLSFDAYYQEPVTERREEQHRVRRVKIYFYLEDDAIQVVEPRLKNSGLPQGTLIRRHRISRPAPYDETYYTAEDFNVGIDLNLYNRVFRIVGCDEFTHNFLRKMGVKVGNPEPVPGDPYMGARKAMDESMQPLRPYERHDTLRQFLDHDRHVLRFYCFWDDSDSLYGDPREMVLNYFLSDDTVEIREVIPANSGRDAAPSFLRRQKLPKRVDALPQPGEVADRTVLNVFGQISSGRYILDNLKTGTQHVEFYNDRDLTIGTYINVYGRKYLLCDCDEFTKEYYRTKYGINDIKAISYNLSRSQPVPQDVYPPYNGWGGEEDSLGNCKGMIPSPPKRDFIKFMEKDRRGLESHVLRFLARMDTEHPIDRDRKFIIAYFLSDDSVLIFEPPQRNSGVIGGKFLERGKMKRPGQERYSTTPPEYYQARDLYIGAEVEINKFKFIIEDADEYAYRYMESHSDEFPYANISSIMEKLRKKAMGRTDDLRSFFARQDPDELGTIGFEQLRALIKQLAEGELVDQEIATLARYYAERPKSEVNSALLLGIAQQLLRKNNFEIFNRVNEAAAHNDCAGYGMIEENALRNVCKSLRMPLPDDLLRAVIQLSKSECGGVKYPEFIASINWRENPLPAPAEFTGVLDSSWTGNADLQPKGCQVDRIRWDVLFNDLCGQRANGVHFE